MTANKTKATLKKTTNKTQKTLAMPIQPRVVLGLRAEKWREIAGLSAICLALLLFLSLISNSFGKAWIGALGVKTAKSAEFLFGDGWISYIFPTLLVLASIHALRGGAPFHAPRKVLSGALIILSLCTLRAIPYALTANAINNEMVFNNGGFIGSYLATSKGLGLAQLWGPVGARLICFLLLTVGLMLATDFLFLPLVRRAYWAARERLAEIRRPKPVATLTFDRVHHPQRVFPVIEHHADGQKLKELPYARAAGDQRDLLDALSPEKENQQEPAEDEKSKASRFPRIFSSSTRNKGGKSGAGEPPLEPMVQTEIDFSGSGFVAPSFSLFAPAPPVEEEMDRDEVLEISGELEKALSDFGISARVVAVTHGPVVTLYELQPAPGVKVSRILSLENDIALVLRARSVRIQAPIPGKAAVGIEVPNRKVTPVNFIDLISARGFRVHKSSLAFPLGKSISGEIVLCDLAAMPHLLIAGTTGSGKSVCVNVIISSILFRMPPDRVKFIMIDPKRVELNVYSDIPHLLAPVVNEPRQAAAALMWAVGQMEERLEIFSKLRVRNIDSYNAVASGSRDAAKGVDTENLKQMSHIVIVIDELADLMIIAKNEVEEFIVRLAQMSRAAGIHMIIATQRPSVNVLTGIIKANFPSRIAFRVSAKVDSRTILDMNGAETLLGKGDMLYSPGGTKAIRIQGAFVSDPDIEALTDYLRSQNPSVPIETANFSEQILSKTPPPEDPAITEFIKPGAAGGPTLSAPRLEIPTEGARPAHLDPRHAAIAFPDLVLRSEQDEDEMLYDKALRLVLETRKPSVSMIQRRIKIGFARAGRLMDLMEERGVVGPYLGSKPRQLLVDDPDEMLDRLSEAGI